MFFPHQMEGYPHAHCTTLGARAYYMKTVLHDWNDSLCETILARVKEAMTPGYSKLLIQDLVVPATRPSYYDTSLDMTMLTMLSAKERTEAEWRSLLEGKAGLKVTGIWRPGRIGESVIECELP